MMSFLSCKPTQNLTTVQMVDIEKYSGQWYEIARLPNSFEKGLECVTATYTLKINGFDIDNLIKVNQECHK